MNVCLCYLTDSFSKRTFFFKASRDTECIPDRKAKSQHESSWDKMSSSICTQTNKQLKGKQHLCQNAAIYIYIYILQHFDT